MVGLVDLFTPLSGRLVNINTASVDALQVLPQIDENVAQAIRMARAGPDGVEGFAVLGGGDGEDIAVALDPHALLSLAPLFGEWSRPAKDVQLASLPITLLVLPHRLPTGPAPAADLPVPAAGLPAPDADPPATGLDLCPVDLPKAALRIEAMVAA